MIWREEELSAGQRERADEHSRLWNHCSCSGRFLAEDFGVGAANVVSVQHERIGSPFAEVGDSVLANGGSKRRLNPDYGCLIVLWKPPRRIGCKQVWIEGNPRDWFLTRRLGCIFEKLNGVDDALLTDQFPLL